MVRTNMKLFNKIILVLWSSLLLLMLGFGCRSKKSNTVSGPQKTLKLTLNLDISANNPKALIDSFSGLAVDKSGNMYVADQQLDKINIFDSDGHYLDSLGSSGRGPGEFASINPGIRIKKDTLYVMDRGLRRIDLFDIHKRRFINSFNIPNAASQGTKLGSPRDMFPDAEGNIMISFDRPYFYPPKATKHWLTLSVLKPDGQFLRKIVAQTPVLYPSNQTVLDVETNGGQISRITVFTHLTYYPDTKITMDNENHIYVGNSDSLSLLEYNENSRRIGVLRADLPVVKMTNVLKDSVFHKKSNKFRKAVNHVGVPDRWPAYQKIFFDDRDRCWVELLDPYEPEQTWWVFDASGKPTWKFTLSSKITLYTVRNGEAYGIWQDRGKYSRIIRYRIKGM